MTRDIFLIVYHSRLFPAHWGIWVPSARDAAVGKVIHVTGDAATGFDHEFKRNYSPEGTARKYSLVLLAEIEDKYVIDKQGDGSLSLDKDAVDDIERKALTIPAPGKSLNSTSGQAIKAKVQILNCQTWAYDLTIALVESGVFPEAAIATVADSPKN